MAHIMCIQFFSVEERGKKRNRNENNEIYHGALLNTHRDTYIHIYICIYIIFSKKILYI